MGPLSEASIGNVGMNPVSRGWVDHVITPAGAFALMVGEDVLDRSFLKWVEARTVEHVRAGDPEIGRHPGACFVQYREWPGPVVPQRAAA